MKKRPVSAQLPNSSPQNFDILEYLTFRQMIRTKHKSNIYGYFQPHKEEPHDPTNMLVRRGPSILGSKSSMNTRPTSSHGRLRPYSELDSGKVTKLKRNMDMLRTQTSWIQTLLKQDNSLTILKNVTAMDKQNRTPQTKAKNSMPYNLKKTRVFRSFIG